METERHDDIPIPREHEATRVPTDGERLIRRLPMDFKLNDEIGGRRRLANSKQSTNGRTGYPTNFINIDSALLF